MRVAVVGEGMVELTPDGDRWRAGYGGDTLNTAIHLARAGIATGFVSALGDDPSSRELRAGWRAEGLDCGSVITHPTRGPGLYLTRLATDGARSFTYWRDSSAAREMFSLPGSAAAIERAERAKLLYFSLISLAILPDADRIKLLALAQRVRKTGGSVAFDSNYRARLWRDAAEAASWRDAAVAVCDIGLPTLADEGELNGGADADVVAAHWRRLGCAEVVIKLDVRGCRLADGTLVPPPQLLVPVDSSGAGDAFNAGYLAARLDGQDQVAAALAGHRLAGWTILRRGAIPPPDRLQAIDL